MPTLSPLASAVEVFDFLNMDEVPSCDGLPADVQAELNAHYDDMDALRGTGQQEPPDDEPVYQVCISLHGKKFIASVQTPDGRKVKAGTHLSEAAAWDAAEKKANELRGKEVRYIPAGYAEGACAGCGDAILYPAKTGMPICGRCVAQVA